MKKLKISCKIRQLTFNYTYTLFLGLEIAKIGVIHTIHKILQKQNGEYSYKG